MGVSTAAGEISNPIPLLKLMANLDSSEPSALDSGINELLENHLANTPDLSWFCARSIAGFGVIIRGRISGINRRP